MSTDHTPEVLYGMTMGFVALALELSNTGHLNEGQLIERMERFARSLDDPAGSVFGSKWLRETADMIKIFSEIDRG